MPKRRRALTARHLFPIRPPGAARSSNGKTPDSDSVNRGSNPRGASSIRRPEISVAQRPGSPSTIGLPSTRSNSSGGRAQQSHRSGRWSDSPLRRHFVVATVRPPSAVRNTGVVGQAGPARPQRSRLSGSAKAVCVVRPLLYHHFVEGLDALVFLGFSALGLRVSLFDFI